MEYATKVLLLCGGMLAASAAIAQRERLPADCRQEIVERCRGTKEGLRSCLLIVAPKLSDRCRGELTKRTSAARPLPEGFVEERYGTDPKQTLAYARPVLNRTVAVLVFIHGGGWSIGDKSMSVGDKAAHFTGEGWAFATVNYRLVPGATVEQQAADVASALAWLRAHAKERGFDPNRIVIIGHSAGAHLAALVGTDPTYLTAAGVPMSSVKGIVLLDGAGYDIPAQMAFKGNLVADMYDAAFGKDPARQKALSPTFQSGAPNVATWLILPVERRPDSQAQSNGLAAALRKGGSVASVVPVPGESHTTLNRGLGEADDFATGQIDRFLAAIH
ncbi:MAG TPA: alpha/beta hydrolase [Sphingomicrobium sp.]|nr:alpha/beta hydrolase [Sphingomicrobium sp.]